MARLRAGAIVAGAFALGVLLVLLARHVPRAGPEPAPPSPAPPPAPRPPLLKPRPDYAPLRQRVAAFAAARSPVTFGIYFQDLTSGAEWGIGERVPIRAASTVKVPIVLYLNELAARGEIDLAERVAYNPDSDYQTGAGILQFAARPGDTYSLRTLATLAIVVSDNVATRMLLRRLGRDRVAAFMRRLGGETVYPGGENITTARDMGAYIRAVLDFARRRPDLGNRLLDDMAHSIYHVGLPGQLPPRIKVAHKEGDVSGMAGDVGVVFSRRPYILCILMSGIEDVDAAFADIARISRMVYDYQEALASR